MTLRKSGRSVLYPGELACMHLFKAGYSKGFVKIGLHGSF